MKARKVKGLDPDGDFASNARRIVEVRLSELERLAGLALKSGESRALHDMRIAAKRLRYVLEMASPALGDAAEGGARTAKRLQSLLGEIHDCDESVPRVAAHVERLRAQDVQALRAAAGAAAEDLPPAAALEAPNRERYAGLDGLTAYLVARRAVLLDRLRREWPALEMRGFAVELLNELSPRRPERPAQTGGGAP